MTARIVLVFVNTEYFVPGKHRHTHTHTHRYHIYIIYAHIYNIMTV